MKRFIVFFLIFSGAYLFIHLYVADFISRFCGYKDRVRMVFLLFCVFSLSLFFIRRYLSEEFVSYLSFAFFVWMGFVFLASFIFLVSDIIVKLFKIDFKRIFWISVSLSVITTILSIINGIKMPLTKEIVFFSDKVDRDYQFYYLSDIHLDFGYKNRIFKRIFRYLNSSDAEFVVIGGDLFDPGFKYQEYMNSISAKPVYFVRGNHEYYYGIDKVYRYLKPMGFQDITNSSVVWGKLNLIGIDDIKSKRLSFNEVNRLVLQHYKNDFLNIIFSHQPLYFDRLALNYDMLMLTGHTHCGQLFPFHIFTKLFYSYLCGRYDNKTSSLYVSSGAGVWGPPMRFLTKAEIVRVVIKRV